LAGELERAGSGLAGGTQALATAWPAGLGTAPAQRRVGDHVTAVRDAVTLVRRVAAALSSHAYALDTLRQLAQQDRSADELSSLGARVRELEERTGAALLANRPSRGARRARSPEEVAAWWRSLGWEGRERLLREQPRVVGRLDGVSADDRDRANRTVLAADIAALTAREAELAARLDRTRFGLPPLLAALVVSGALPLELELQDVRSRLAGLLAVRSALTGQPRALLLDIDPGSGGGDGRAVVALGDPDHAQHTAVFVPGLNSDLRDTPGNLSLVSRLWREADGMTFAGGDVCAVLWLGYDAPETLEALSYGPARAGGGELAPFLDGLGAAHDPTASHVTLVGHSYGSTVVAEAALRGGLAADDIVAVGSPGMHTDHAAALGLDPRHVWGGIAADDPVGGSLGELSFVHGEEPTDPAFGANRFVVDTRGHNDYWHAGSQSLRNQAAIVVGRYDLVGLVHGGLPSTGDSQAASSLGR